MSQTILYLTDSNFSEYISGSVAVEKKSLFLIDFWAEWCNPCKMITPIIEEIAAEFKNTLEVAKVNVDNNPIITKRYNIRSIPTLLLIRNDVVLSTKVGLLSKEQIKNFVNTYL